MNLLPAATVVSFATLQFTRIFSDAFFLIYKIPALRHYLPINITFDASFCILLLSALHLLWKASQ